MVNYPTVANIENFLVLAQRVELLVGATVGAAATADKLSLMRNLELSMEYPESRFNHGTIRSYGHGAPDIGLRFTLSVTQDILAYLRTRGLRSTSGVIPVYSYALKVTSNDGTAKTITIRGKLTQKTYKKFDAEQGAPTDVECFIRVIDENEPAAT